MSARKGVVYYECEAFEIEGNLFYFLAVIKKALDDALGDGCDNPRIEFMQATPDCPLSIRIVGTRYLAEKELIRQKIDRKKTIIRRMAKKLELADAAFERIMAARSD